MSKIIQAASAIALAAATSTAFAWYGAAPYQPVAPAQQQQAMAEQQRAMMEQHDQAMRDAFAARSQFAEQQLARSEQFQPQYRSHPGFAPAPFTNAPAFPEMAPMPEWRGYPEMPEMPTMPEFGQYPSMPETAFPSAPDSMQERIAAMDAYRAESRKHMEERRAAMRKMHEERRTLRQSNCFERCMHEAAPGEQTTATQ